jgi:hypothetical protein
VTERERENAKKLVTGSRVFAANSREGFAEQYPSLKALSADEWDGLLGVAGTGTALLMIPGRYAPAEQKELTGAVMETLHAWNQSSVLDLAAFVNFVTSKAKDPNGVPDVIGSWILRDLNLTESEQSAPHVLGVMLMNTFGPWWDQ